MRRIMKNSLVIFLLLVALHSQAQTDSVRTMSLWFGVDALKFALKDYEGQLELRMRNNSFVGIGFGYEKSIFDDHRHAQVPYSRGERWEGWTFWPQRYFHGEGISGRFWAGKNAFSIEFVYKQRAFTYYAFHDGSEAFAEDGRQRIFSVTLNLCPDITIQKFKVVPLIGIGGLGLLSKIKRYEYYIIENLLIPLLMFLSNIFTKQRVLLR
jgi:hypothetical protein